MPAKRDALTVNELAARAGVSTTTWIRHRDDGAPLPKGPTPREIERWLLSYHAWRLDRLGKHRRGEPETQDPEANEADAEAWSVERKKWLALLAKTEWHLRTGRLVPREDLVVVHAEDARGHLQVEVAPLVERFGHRAVPEEVEAHLR